MSVLFADLVGFTPFAEERDSEDVRETLSRYFDTARDVIDRYGGTIEKFIGDAVMAVWGAPTAHEDDAERAVRAALELVEAVGGLKDGVQARAGVLTGEAAVTVGVVGEGMVVGDIVNTASRLQSVAPPGAVIVGEQTRLATSASIAYERAEDQTLKGKASPVPAWRALRVVAEVGGRNRAEGLEAPFVGRQEEMRLLKDLFHLTGRERRVRVMSVVGPAGIGKSRLAREFSNYLDGVVETVLWHQGRSPAYGEGISFWALGEMVRERAKLREGDDEQTTRQRIKQTVDEYVTDASERDWIENALLTLLGFESGTAADQLFGAWRTFFERMAEKSTVCLVFEDMHFADTGLLDFVDHLLEWSRGLPIYVVTLARPDLIEKRPTWGAGKRNFNSLYLEPLAEADMRELLTGLVPGLPESAVKTIVARADGIPLYAVETVRTLLGEGRLVIEKGVCVPADDLSTLAVPATLTALISARLDALDEADRRILHDASVLGQSFTPAGVAALSGTSEADLEPRFAGLVRRELLQREMDPRSPEQGQYVFVQALIREVAYNTLSKHDRKKLHLAAARYFESLGSDELAGVLASHYLAALASAGDGPDADALAAQARIALKAAGGRAAALGSFDGARAFYEQALAVTTDAPERVDLLIRAGEAARTSGGNNEGEQLLRTALEEARRIGDREASARATAALGFVLSVAFRGAEAIALVGPALEEFADVDEVILGQLRTTLGRAIISHGDPRPAIPHLEAALETAERHGLFDAMCGALIARANGLAKMGRRHEAIAVMELAMRLAAEHGLTDYQLRAAGNLGIAKADEDLRASLGFMEESLALARRTGHRALLLNGIGNYAYQAFSAGEWDTALALCDEALAEDISARSRLFILNNAIIIRAARGDRHFVDEGLAEMERLGRDMTDEWRPFLADPLANAEMAWGDLKRAYQEFMSLPEADFSQAPEYFYRAARIALWLGDLADAQHLLERLDQTGATGSPAVDARHVTMRAGIAALEGRTAEALALYRDALRRWRDVHGPWDEALTGLDMATLLNPAEPEVTAAIASSRAIFERLGAKPYLDKLDAAASRGPAPASRTKPSSVAAEVASNS